MGERSIDAILEEWRACERKLDTTIDPAEWVTLNWRVMALRVEYRQALHARQRRARQIRKAKP